MIEHRDKGSDSVKMNKMKKALMNPKTIFWNIAQIGGFRWMTDESYLKLAYKIMVGGGVKLNLENPATYNEKLQWLKLYDRKPIYVTMVDKYEAKKYVAQIIGEEYIIPTYGVWDSFDQIDFDKLPEQFVLKCTHDSGGIAICRDKTKFEVESARRLMNKNLRHNFYWTGREWPYKNVKPRIIAEKYMEDSNDRDLRDYKFFTFDGAAKLMFVASDRQAKNVETHFDFFDMEYNHLPVKNGHNNSRVCPSKPKNFNQMRMLAERLGKGIPQARIDFYEINEKVYFGEITLFHYSGMVPFEPAEWDKKFGDWIKLPELKMG